MAHKVSSSEASTSSGEGDYDELWEIPWVQIPDVPYIIKYKFDDDKYIIFITNLSETHGEKLTAAEVQERFNILNPHAEMKTSVLMKHLEDSLKDFLEKKSNDSEFMQQCVPPQAITLHLTFKVCQVLVAFDIKPQLLPNEKLRTHVIAPTILTSNIVSREYDRLKKSIWTKNPKMYDSRLNKKSKISEIELLDAFLKFQSTVVQNCVERSKTCEDEHNRSVEVPKDLAKTSRKESNVYHRFPEVAKSSVITLREEPLAFHREFEFTDEEIFGVFNSGVKEPSASSDLLKDYKLDVKRENVKKNYIGKRKKPPPKDTEGEKPSSSKDTQAERPSSNEPQAPEMSTTSVKQEIEDSSKSEVDSSSTAGIGSSKANTGSSIKTDSDSSDTDSSPKAEDDSDSGTRQKKKRCLKF